MNTTTKKSLVQRVRENTGASLVLKMLFLGLLLLLFLIPLGLIRRLVEDRESYRRGAEDEVIGQWGGEQTLAGPFLVVPYVFRQQDEKGRVVESTQAAFFLPEELEVAVEATPQKRRRGIFEVTLYTAQLYLTGAFRPPAPGLPGRHRAAGGVRRKPGGRRESGRLWPAHGRGGASPWTCA